MEIARILNVNHIKFIIEEPRCAENIIQIFFRLDEDNHYTFLLLQFFCNPDKHNASDDKSIRYNGNDKLLARAPAGISIDCGVANEFLREWCLRKTVENQRNFRG